VNARAPWIAALLLSGLAISWAGPRPNIPPNELPGHERDRFIDPFPQLRRADPVITPQQAAPRAKRKCGRARNSKARNRC